MHLYAKKAFCVISSLCYTDLFEQLLEKMFEEYLGKSKNPHAFQEISDSFIRAYQSQIKKIEQIQLDDSNEKQNPFHQESDEGPMKVNWKGERFLIPSSNQFSFSPVSFSSIYFLFKLLTVNNIIVIYEAMLLERNIIFVSDSQKVVGYAIEAFLSFLFPLKWQYVLLPLLPATLLDFLEAPFPFIAGLPQNLLSNCQNKINGIIVLLESNEVLIKDKFHEAFLINHFKEAKKKLTPFEIYSKQSVDRYFKFSNEANCIPNEKQIDFDVDAVRDVFFNTIMFLLMDYELYFKQIDSMDRQDQQTFNFAKNYETESFVKSQPKNIQIFMRKFCGSALFVNFINRRFLEPSNPEINLLDQAMAEQRKRGRRGNFAAAICSVLQIKERYSEKEKSHIGDLSLRKATSMPHQFSPVGKNYSKRASEKQQQSTKVETRDSLIESEKVLEPSVGWSICKTLTSFMGKTAKVGPQTTNLAAWPKRMEESVPKKKQE